MKKLETNSILSGVFCYKAKDFYLLTIPKIASSWVYELFLHNKKLRDIPNDRLIDSDKNTVNINQLNFNLELNDEISYDVVEFQKDWNNLFKGTAEKDFIFLMRDPISKFITGLMQDVILNDFNMSSPNIVNILNQYPNKEELQEFNLFNQSKIFDNCEEWWHRPDIKWEISIRNVMLHIVENILDKWIKNVDNLIEYRKGHKNMNLFFYYKLLFNSNISKDRIKILDIDKENIYEFIKNKYNLDLNHSESKYKFNETSNEFKRVIKKSMIKYEEIISSVLSMDLLLYCDIYNYLYSTKITSEEIWFERLLKFRNE